MAAQSLVLNKLSIQNQYGEYVNSSTLESSSIVSDYAYKFFDVYCHTCTSEFIAHRGDGFSATRGSEGIYNFKCLYCGQQDNVKLSKINSHFRF